MERKLVTAALQEVPVLKLQASWQLAPVKFAMLLEVPVPMLLASALLALLVAAAILAELKDSLAIYLGLQPAALGNFAVALLAKFAKFVGQLLVPLLALVALWHQCPCYPVLLADPGMPVAELRLLFRQQPAPAKPADPALSATLGQLVAIAARAMASPLACACHARPWQRPTGPAAASAVASAAAAAVAVGAPRLESSAVAGVEQLIARPILSRALQLEGAQEP